MSRDYDTTETDVVGGLEMIEQQLNILIELQLVSTLHALYPGGTGIDGQKMDQLAEIRKEYYELRGWA